MAWEVFFNNGINVASGGHEALDALVTELVNEQDLQLEYGGYKEALGFVEQMARSKNEKFSSRAGVVEMDEIHENSVMPEAERTKNPNKGFDIKQYGNKLTTSKLMTKWLKQSNTLEWAKDDIIKEFDKMIDDGKDLIEMAMMRITQEMVKVYTEWFSITSSFGPGSPTPKGNSLFSINHTARQWQITFGNVDPSGVHQPLSATSLQTGLDVLKSVVRGENGYRVKNAKYYELICGTDLAVTARTILNDPQYGGQPTGLGQYSGTGTNANQANQFTFKGNQVRIVEIPFLGDYDKNNNQIGTDSNWFLRNPEIIKKSRALKMISLYDVEIDNYYVKDTKAYVIDADMGFAVDHYGAEIGLFGSKGDGSTQLE